MTDEIKGFTVILERDIREDDAERIINAIAMIKGVSLVKSHIVDGNDYIIETRTLQKIEEKMYKLFKELQ